MDYLCVSVLLMDLGNVGSKVPGCKDKTVMDMLLPSLNLVVVENLTHLSNLNTRRTVFDTVQDQGRVASKSVYTVSEAVDTAREVAGKPPLVPSIFEEACSNPNVPFVQPFNVVEGRIRFSTEVQKYPERKFPFQNLKTALIDCCKMNLREHGNVPLFLPSLSLGELGTDAQEEQCYMQWKSMFDALKQYKNEPNHCNVPCRDEVLGTWVKTSRAAFKKDTLSDEQKEMFNSAGFV